MFIWRLWGDLWVVEDLDWIDILARMIVSILLAALTIVVVLAVVAPLYAYRWFVATQMETEAVAILPRAEQTRAAVDECPYCGNTRFLDIEPCVRCGRALRP